MTCKNQTEKKMTDKEKEKKDLSEFRLDQFRLGELTEEEKAQIQYLLANDTKAASHLTALEKESKDFAEKFSIANLAADALQRAEQEKEPKLNFFRQLLRPQWITGTLVTMGIAIALIFNFSPIKLKEPTIRIKGGFFAYIYAKRGDHQWKVEPRDFLAPKDLVRFVYSSPIDGYLYVVGIDAAQKITLYEPDQNKKPKKISIGQNQQIPGAIELDETLGTERFFVLVCPNQLDPSLILKTAKQAIASAKTVLQITKLNLLCEQTFITIQKTKAL